MSFQSILNKSLANRLLIIISGWTLAALIVTGVLLATAFKNTTERNFENLLLAHVYNLMGAIDLNESGQLIGEPNLGDPRFLAPGSGWSWMVSLADAPSVPLLYSASLSGDEIALSSTEKVPFDDKFQRSYSIESPTATEKHIEAQLFIGDTKQLYQVMVSGNQVEVKEATNAFIRQLILFFSLFGIGTIVASAFAVRFGLRPLEKAQRELNAVREGKIRSLERKYPKEIEPLVVEINELISSNLSVTERARTQVGNLAHALKTPLAVLKNEAAEPTQNSPMVMREQTAKMQAQVETYLNRARISAQVGTLNAQSNLAEVSNGIIRVLEKLNPQLNFEKSVETNFLFAVEKQDLEEICGNLLENATNFAATTVSVSAINAPSESGKRSFAQLTVEDDGEGVSPKLYDEILKRGKRLDESIPGSGLGLSIVTDIVEEYGGKVELDSSQLGGLKATVFLPAIRDAKIDVAGIQDIQGS